MSSLNRIYIYIFFGKAKHNVAFKNWLCRNIPTDYKKNMIFLFHFNAFFQMKICKFVPLFSYMHYAPINKTQCCISFYLFPAI